MPTIDVGENSYVTIAEADDYFAGRIGAEAWDTSDNETKTKALITATIRLEQEMWVGRRTAEDQSLAWPRFGVKDPDGWLIPDDEVPEAIKRGQMEIALSLLTGELELEDTGLELFEELKVGPIAMKMRFREGGELPAHARREFEFYLTTTSRANIRVWRA